MTVNNDDVPESGLPSAFKNINKKGSHQLSCITLELKKRQQRWTDTLNEIFLLSDQIIQDLLKELCVEIGK